MPIIKVTGLMDIEDDELDAGPNGPLTEEAFLEYSRMFPLDDLSFTLVEEEKG